MLIEIIIAILLGCTIGTFTGLIPGIHINLLGIILISLSLSLLSFVNPIILVVFIVAMAVTHTFVDYVPSVFLGAPDSDTFLSILPGHELLKKGHGHEAVFLTALGGLLSLASIFLISIIFILFLEKINNYIKIIIPYLLILVSIFLILEENKKLTALVVFLMSGLLGTVVLTSTIQQPLLPLLTGLFGSSALIISIKQKTKIPKQKIIKSKIIKKQIIKPILSATLFAPICSFLPGLGTGQAAVLANQFFNLNRKHFLIMIGATNTIVMSLSFIALYSISRTRTGAAVAINSLVHQLSAIHLILILLLVLISGISGFFITIAISKKICNIIHKINYNKISLVVLIILTGIVLKFSGFLGLLIFAAATFTGIFGISSNVKRINLMGSLLIPTILFYLII